jgi:hypothetical protein
MSWVTAAIIGGGAALVGGYMQGQAAKSAARTQAGAINRATDVQQEQFDVTQQQGAPGRAAGYNALNQINRLGSGTYGMYDAQGNPTGETGIGSGYFTKEYTPEDFAQGIDPGYQFRLAQGQEATNRAANRAGGIISGNALRGVQDYTQGLASEEFTGAFNRFQTGRTNIYNTLAGIAGLGQNAYNTSATTGTTAAGNIGTNIANAGAAQAGGTVGSANAIAGGLQNAGSQYYLSQLLAPKTGGVNYGLNIGGGGSSGGGMGITAPSSGNIDYMGGGQGLSLKT